MQARLPLLGRIRRDVALAMEKTAQQAVAGIAHLAHATHHARHRHAHQHQRMAGEHQAGFERVGHDLGRSGRLQPLHVRIVERAHDHRQRRVDRVRVVQDLERGRRVRERDHQGAGARQARGDQGLAPRAVAIYHRLARGGGLAHPLRIQVQRDVAYALLLEKARQVLPGAAIAAQHHVLCGRHAGDGYLVQREGAQHPFRGDEAQHQFVAVMNQDRRAQHRQEHRRQDGLQQGCVHQAGSARLRQQHEAEFARLGQGQRRAQGIARSGPEQARQESDQRELEQHRQREQQQYQAEFIDHHGHVQLHADGDEKQSQQQIAERLDVLFHLVPVFGFRDQHTGQKSAQRKRQAGKLGGPGEAEGDQQHVQHEQFVRAPPRHDMEPAAHQLLPGEQDQRQHHRGLCQRQRQHRREVLRRLRQRRDQDQQRHHRQILEQQNADDLAPVRGFELHALGQEFDHDGGRGHGERPAQRKTELPGKAQQPGERGRR